MTARHAFLATVLAVAAGGMAFPAAAAAQDTWVSAWGGIFMDPATVRDGETGTEWDFGTSAVFGVTAQRLFGSSLIAGLEVGYSPVKHEVRLIGAPEGTPPTADGRAHLLTTMAVGRLGGAGGGGFATYLTGGVGAITYGIPSLETWDSDLALRAGGGVEYRSSPRLALFVEWNRWWTFHQAEGVDDNTIRHNHLELGLRFGL